MRDSKPPLESSVLSVPIGQLPPLGVVPRQMQAYVIRPDRFGPPAESFQRETLPVWEIGPDEVLVLVMAAGVNYNGIWAGLGHPVDVLKVGDEVVAHCNHLLEPGSSDRQTIWGYETPDGSMAQYCRVQGQQLLRKPEQLTWEEAASYGLVYFTAHRMLLDRAEIKPGEDVLVWGGAGGLGVFAIQLCKAAGCRVIAVVSSEEKGALALSLGADGVINRKDFPDLQFSPGEDEAQGAKRGKAMRAFGKRIWEILGERKSVEVVFEHVGQSTFPASVWLAARYGRIVICGATTGYDLTFDVRHLWMKQKRIIGSHFADADSSRRANRLIEQGLVKPVMTEYFPWDEIPAAHQAMYENRILGTVSCLVGAPRPGLTNLAETRKAIAEERS